MGFVVSALGSVAECSVTAAHVELVEDPFEGLRADRASRSTRSTSSRSKRPDRASAIASCRPGRGGAAAAVVVGRDHLELVVC